MNDLQRDREYIKKRIENQIQQANLLLQPHLEPKSQEGYQIQEQLNNWNKFQKNIEEIAQYMGNTFSNIHIQWKH
ncbi:hypothetical protein [Holospora curviuscula]|uniref:Uncharacterized protein n=1 Tax=Holospora curviuscula TaxID=1082868 RepID=A0A2S5R9N0_9PROT|nr:hypothetical protein [Holospora curviuscula]PPE04007.1 hypothetical protein HCUR_00542 [Holospora curviuscula]